MSSSMSRGAAGNIGAGIAAKAGAIPDDFRQQFSFSERIAHLCFSGKTAPRCAKMVLSKGANSHG
jgi:hypothetical protein